MKTYYLNELSDDQIRTLCRRTAIRFDEVLPIAQKVIDQIKLGGDTALRELTEKFDGPKLAAIAVTSQEIEQACRKISSNIKKAFETAARNIEVFHLTQLTARQTVETMPGVTCFREARPIEKVGLYIPGGTAPLPSTVLMLAIPAKLAGCSEIVLATPPDKDGRIPDIILFAARLCGVTRIYKAGGAQAIAAMAFGTESVPKVDKIFGPGNQYVTAAKMLVSIDPEGAAIDMPAGPSEILVVADPQARADFVAADLLSQAEHGVDSQAVVVCLSEAKAQEVMVEVEKQLDSLPRKAVTAQALANGFALVVDSIDTAVNFSNRFAPEHLVLNVENAERFVEKVTCAGSVFLGAYSCESAGDYASGTNHSLPTYGYARAYSGVSVAGFQKQVTFQQVTAEGAKNIGPTVALIAAQELLDAHKRAMEIRL